MSAAASTTKNGALEANKSTKQPLRYPFWFGGSAASMAAIVTHPLDLGTFNVSRSDLVFLADIWPVKVRLQTRSAGDPKSMYRTFVHIVSNQGFLGLYNGLSAALLRQVTYSTVRFGVYEDLKSRYNSPPTAVNPNPKPPLINLVLMSSAAGFLGGIAGNPGDVLNVRMQSDFAKAADKRRNYKNAIDGLIRMTREEGLTSLMRGVAANSARALLMTASQLASYDVFKSLILTNTVYPMKDNLLTHFAASLAAGFVATSICSPVDVIKTRVMSAGAKIGILQLLRDAARNEGYLWVWRGWVPSFIRLGPQTICTMIFFEQHKKLYRRWKGMETA